MVQGNGADSEVGQLRTVLMHRPGPELQRLTPRHRERVLLRTLPWLSRARQAMRARLTPQLAAKET